MHQRHIESARAILSTDPAGALRLVIDTIRWSVDWTVHETWFGSSHWQPRVEDVAPLIVLADALIEALDRVVANEEELTKETNSFPAEDRLLAAIALARVFKTSGRLVDLEDLAAELELPSPGSDDSASDE